MSAWKTPVESFTMLVAGRATVQVHVVTASPWRFHLSVTVVGSVSAPAPLTKPEPATAGSLVRTRTTSPGFTGSVVMARLHVVAELRRRTQGPGHVGRGRGLVADRRT